MGLIYDHFTVIGSKIRIKLWTDAGEQGGDRDPKHIALQLLDSNATPSANAFNLREQPGTAYTTMIANSQPYSVTKTFSAKKFFGKNRSNIVGDTELRGSIAADPSEKAYFTLTASDIEAITEGETDHHPKVHWEATIMYTAAWTERKSISQS